MSDSVHEEGLIAKSMIENTPVDASELTGAVEFNLPKYLERQHIIDEILNREYPTDEARVADLNKKIEEWDDDFGISYTAITGRHLPGLEIHGRAHALAFSANEAPHMNIEDAELDFSVMSLSVLKDLKAHGATMNHAILPFVTMSGDLRGVSAIKAVLNFADLNKLDIRGVDLTGAYLMGTRGITKQMYESVADISSAVSDSADPDAPKLVLGNALRAFTKESSPQAGAELRSPIVFSGINSANKIFGKTNRNRTQGIILDDSVISDGEVSKLNFEGSVFHKTDASRLNATKTNMAGVVSLSSKMDQMNAPGLYAPGLVSIDSSFAGSDLPQNAAGAVFINSNLREASAEKMQSGGALVIGGKAPELSEKAAESIRIVQPGELPSEVTKKISKIASSNSHVTAAPKKPELE